MLKLTNRYANALLNYAEEHGMELIYRQALHLTLNSEVDLEQAPEPIGQFLRLVQGGKDEVSAVLYAFLDLAGKHMNLLGVEIISAVPLTQEQLAQLEQKLILMFRKQLNITTTVDPSLLGGVRVIADNIVLDDTIKRKMMAMKDSIYKGVYFK